MKKNEFYDLSIGFSPVPNNQYYLVFVSYSDGDGFVNEENKIVFVDLFESFDKASACQQSLVNSTKTSDFNVKLIDEQNNQWSFYKPWPKYGLKYVEVLPITLFLGSRIYI